MLLIIQLERAYNTGGIKDGDFKNKRLFRIISYGHIRR